MGFDPNRPYKATRFDYLLVGAAICVALGLTVWALYG